MNRTPQHIMNTTQPSKSWRKPSAIPCPQYSTITPMTPMRKLFIRIVIGAAGGAKK